MVGATLPMGRQQQQQQGGDYSDEDRSKRRKRPKRRQHLLFRLQNAWRTFYNNRLQSSPPRLLVVLLAGILLSWISLLLLRRLIRATGGEQIVPNQPLSFLVAGFPKSGTTTLLKTLRLHEQVAMDAEEYCQIARPVQQDDINLKRMNRYLLELRKDVWNERNQATSSIWSWLGLSSSSSAATRASSSSSSPENLLLGIKCPDAVKNFKAIHRLSQHSPNCNIVIGMRHPVLYLQSFYNYRVMEAHLKAKPYTQAPRMVRQGEHIPSLLEIWNSTATPQNRTILNWRDISRNAPRYEMYLSQFAKTDLSVAQMNEWYVDQPFLVIKPNRLRIFVYTMEQLEDPAQSNELRRDLQDFLGLTTEIAPLGHANRIAGNIHQYKEVVNICDKELDPIRREVLEYAKDTVAWMHEFLNSSDVVVSNRPYLVQSINQWASDPCETMKRSEPH
mmetsp:Transcript_7434/g.20621  ORF Transcript_7434/g.20621 Transcript_7434/m.20621 type:complete len:446 (+) Transcript_7434:181-1518(+)|eukprot:CAMPEP_0168728976 /NCGR_PEP_ID=MMETSP0724-20121128/5959_1 /TAXON_ID=265536 /ORGANISM="Amphiprora sp., Strain CCMP467" /LENGTH=445 /DNA_ID=CAMNT_0008775833 /DNA_START=91 /DNA_END=1428 /DNA_ORIENTATION=+